MKLKVKCPCKINLTLKVFKKDEITGFHPIESIMQTVSLYDYITVETTKSNTIEFSGNSDEISYDKNNLIIKTLDEFFKKSKIKNEGLKIYLEKNIPVAAGLAGGSTDSAGVMLILNELYNYPISDIEIFEILSSLGSDINFCYKGGCALCKGKGDDISKLIFEEFPVSIVKPKNLKISTKDAYFEFDMLKEKSNLPNDLEFALLNKHKEIRNLHEKGFQMSGSGPSFFVKLNHVDIKNRDDYEIFEGLQSIPDGVSII